MNMQVTQPGWALVHKDGRPACKQTVAVDFRGKPATLLGGTPPRHPGSTGRIEVRCGKGATEFYPGVFNMKWVAA